MKAQKDNRDNADKLQCGRDRMIAECTSPTITDASRCRLLQCGRDRMIAEWMTFAPGCLSLDRSFNVAAIE